MVEIQQDVDFERNWMFATLLVRSAGNVVERTWGFPKRKPQGRVERDRSLIPEEWNEPEGESRRKDARHRELMYPLRLN